MDTGLRPKSVREKDLVTHGRAFSVSISIFMLAALAFLSLRYGVDRLGQVPGHRGLCYRRETLSSGILNFTYTDVPH